MRHTLRRLLVGAAALAAATTVATPALAAGSHVIQLLPDATVAAGFNTLVSPFLLADGPIQLTNPSTTFELTGGLSGVSLSNPDPDVNWCTADGAQKLTCTVPFPIGVDQNMIAGYMQAELSATKAALGETGKIKVTLSADGIAPVVTTADVTVAEAVDLAAGKSKTVTAKPGGSFEAGLQVHNNADTTAHGTAVIFGTDYAFQSTKKYSNCFYDGDQLNACVFDEDLAAGRSYGLTVPYQLRKDTAAPGDASGEFEWLTADDYADLIKFLGDNGLGGPGVAGTGDKLALSELPATSSLAKQTDPNLQDNWQDVDVTVTGKQGVDLAAVGATFTATAGQTVPVTVGARNVGPATLDWSRSDEPAAAVLVTPPAGTSVAKVPDACHKADPAFQTTPGVTKYLCLSDPLFPAHTSVTWKFEFTVNKASANALGSVEVNPACACDIFSKDINKANNTAKIVLNPAGGSTGGEGGGTGGGGLPITGPRSAVFGGAGVVLVAAGLGGFLFARRRRTRFEA